MDSFLAVLRAAHYREVASKQADELWQSY